MTGWAATNTLRRVVRRDYDLPVQEQGYAALALVEAALDAAADLEGRIVDGPDWNLGQVFNSAGRLAAALRAVREGA